MRRVNLLRPLTRNSPAGVALVGLQSVAASPIPCLRDYTAHSLNVFDGR